MARSCDAPMPSRPARQKKKRSPPRHALVVDREEAIGVTVTCAGGGAAARALLLRHRRFHLAFVAVILPDETGEALAAELAARGVPVVLMSGHPEGIRRGPTSGFPFLRKPFRPKDLLRLALDNLAAGAAIPDPTR